MTPIEEFKQAQKDYKETVQSLVDLNAKYAEEHQNLMSALTEAKSRLLPGDLHKALRPTREALKRAEQARRESSHKMWRILNKDFKKTASDIQKDKSKKEPKDQDSRTEFLDDLSNLDPQSLKDFTPEEAAEWESKYGPKHPQKPKDSPEPPQNP